MNDCIRGLEMGALRMGVPVSGLRSTTLFIMYRSVVFKSSVCHLRLPPWQTLRNSNIQDGVQDGRQL